MVNGKLEAKNPSKKSRRGTCQGGPLSPLLANIYFRRFLLGFEQQQQRLPKLRQARIVSYADDFVICCKPGNGELAEMVAKAVLKRIGLVVNEEKTRRRKLPNERFSFLGYEFGIQYGKDGRKFFGTRPSRKAISSAKEKIHIATARNKTRDSLDVRLKYVNSILRGWGNYFDQGPVQRAYREINEYTWRRVRKWLAVKHKAKGKALSKMSKKYIYEEGLYFLPEVRADRARAKS